MKKFFAILLALTLVFSTLTSCSPKNQSPEIPENTESQETADTGKDEKNDDTSGDAQSDNDAPPKQPTEKPSINGGDITETVLFDEKDVKITATKLECSRTGAEVTLLLENNTSKTLQFLSGTLSCSANSVNGWMVDDGYLNATVASGKKSYETVRIGADNLALLGISDIADISLFIMIEDNDYNTYALTGPMRLETSLAAAYDYSVDTYRAAIEGSVLDTYSATLLTTDETANFDHLGFRVLSQALLRNTDGEYIVLTELENTSSEDMKVFSQNFSVNGIIIEASRWSSATVLAGKRAVIASNLSDMVDANVWDVLDLGEISKIGYAFGLIDSENDILMEAQPLGFSVPGVDSSSELSGTELYNGSGIRIFYMGFAEDSWDLSDDIHLVLLVENTTSGSITVDDEWNTMSINGFMTDCSIYSSTFPANSIGVMDVELHDMYLEKVNVTSIDDIAELEVTLDIRNENYKQIDTPTIKVEK